MVVYDSSNQSVHSFNFCEMAPVASKFDMFHSNASLSKLVCHQLMALICVCVCVCVCSCFLREV